jgi:hypothetical protein
VKWPVSRSATRRQVAGGVRVGAGFAGKEATPLLPEVWPPQARRSMHDHEFFSRVLGLAAPWQVKEVKLELPARVEVSLECRGEHGWTGLDGLRRQVRGWEERRWRNLDTMQLDTVLIARVLRLLDPQTGCTEMAVVPWAAKSARWTPLFEAGAVRLLEVVPNVSRAAELLRLDWHSAWELKARAVARGLERRQVEPISTLGLDEKSFGRGQDYATVLTDPAGRRVLEVVAGRTQAAAEGALAAGLKPEQRAAEQAVSIDMCRHSPRPLRPSCRRRASSSPPSTSSARRTRPWMWSAGRSIGSGSEPAIRPSRAAANSGCTDGRGSTVPAVGS